MHQRLIYVVGPSGAGKDSLLTWLQAHTAGNGHLHWARRTVTRPAAAGGEAHESLTPAAFATAIAEDAFAMHWQANGLAYGIRHAELAPLAEGHWVMVNGSRGWLQQALLRFPGLRVVQVTARPEVLRARLLSRGREAAAEVDARMDRAPALRLPAGISLLEVTNNTTLTEAGGQLLRGLAAWPGWPAAGGTR